MHIKGLKPTTLVDYPGHVAATIQMGGCNFMCPYCNRRSLVVNPDRTEDISADDIFDFLDSRKTAIDGVCITGGEPLMQDGILEFMAALQDKGFSVKLDTNGSYPTVLNRILKDHLADYIAMDIKNSPANYPRTIGVNDLNINDVKISASFLMDGDIPYEFRTTVCRELHTFDDIETIGKWLQGARAFYLQHYISGDDVIMPVFSSYSTEDMLSMRDILQKYITAVEIR
ncbi:MAG: anaerobic ribonucleoside-triphosphate reductase activating protein [Lachnospiraceae bacterium]|nr:anaerobic ribonucleoside-triphosphate reductase activating protein [Lachnospiraceae bacterium]